MNAHELKSQTTVRHGYGPLAIGANATVTSKIIDRQGYGGLNFILGYGAIVTTGTVVTVIAKEGDVTGTLTSVADADLVGTETLASRLGGATTSGTGSNVRKQLGYKGTKRYVQISLVKTGTTSVGAVDVTAQLFNPETVSGMPA
jgi:hypothetical protein